MYLLVYNTDKKTATKYGFKIRDERRVQIASKKLHAIFFYEFGNYLEFQGSDWA